MLRKLFLTIAVLLFFTALGLGIFAHATYTMTGSIDAAVLGWAVGGVVSLIVAGVIVRRVTHDKPVDLTHAVNRSLNSVMLGLSLIAFGLVFLGVAAPLAYGGVEMDVARMGVDGMVQAFPAESLRPAIKWLYEGFGAIGVVAPIVIVGLLLLVFGWRFVRPARR